MDAQISRVGDEQPGLDVLRREADEARAGRSDSPIRDPRREAKACDAANTALGGQPPVTRVDNLPRHYG